jgi:AraC family transcriptional regulator, positive regulator of tynA and feaB
MKILFSTADVSPRDRFDYWHSVATKNLVSHNSWPECRSRFQAELRSGTLADIGLVLFGTSPMLVEHTERQAARSSDSEMFVCRQVAGTLALEQDGHDVILGPGDVALLDPRLPYTGRFTAESRLLVLKVPRRALTARMGCVRGPLLHPIRPSGGEAGLASAFLGMLPTYADELTPAAAEALKSSALDLIALALANSIDKQRSGGSHAQMLVLMNVRAAVEGQLADPNLDASTVAAAAGVSVRYANAVLAREGTSIRRLILARRLARCRKALTDASNTGRTVTDIAYAWGFSDLTHFGRSFKRAYGVTPSDCRRSGRVSD